MHLEKLIRHLRLSELTILSVILLSLLYSKQGLAQSYNAHYIHISYSEPKATGYEYGGLSNMKIMPFEENRPAKGVPGISEVLRKLEKSRFKPLTIFDNCYVYMRYDFIDNGNVISRLLNTALGVRINNGSEKGALLLELRYNNDNNLGIINPGIVRRSLFFYDGYFHEFYYYHENRNAFDVYYTLTAKIAF